MVKKAVITAAARDQRSLPLQRIINRDGEQNTVLGVIVDEALQAGIEEVGLVICPGDEAAYRTAAGARAERIRFLTQDQPRGYGHAVHCAREFVRDEPFLHMVGDHLYVNGDRGCAQQLIETAKAHSCSVSGVQSTREHLLPYFGTIGGRRVPGTRDLFTVERVAEKPTPTEAEQALTVPGLRTGHYLCFFGMHLLTPTVMDLLHDAVRTAGEAERIQLSPVLSRLASRERYLALAVRGRRYPVDARYGLLTAQLALALCGKDREEVLAGLCELLAQREMAGELS